MVGIDEERGAQHHYAALGVLQSFAILRTIEAQR
jgi:hypothetical protein